MLSIRSQRVNIKGLDIHYLTVGHGEPLIIVHGGSEGAVAWKDNIAALAKKYTIYVPDMPGFGSSQSYAGNYSIPDMVDFVDNFALSMGLPRFFMMGHSLGGGIALHYTLKFPEKVRKLVLVSSLCLGKEIAWWIRLLTGTPIYPVIGNAAMSFYKGLKSVANFFGSWEIMEPVTKTSIQIGGYISNITEQTIVLLSQLPLIGAPTLVLWGAKDPVVPFAQAYAAAELIPDCQVRVFDNCGHSVYRENLREFSSVLSRFLG